MYSGQYSSSLLVALRTELGVNLSAGFWTVLLTTPFYVGQFFIGRANFIRTPLSWSLLIFHGRRMFPWAQQAEIWDHDCPYRGFLTCAYDSCNVTAEIKKESTLLPLYAIPRENVKLPYIREDALGDRLGKILRDIHIPMRSWLLQERCCRTQQGLEEEIRIQTRVLQQRHPWSNGGWIQLIRTSWTVDH